MTISPRWRRLVVAIADTLLCCKVRRICDAHDRAITGEG
jgi:hypothetical protein